MIQNNYFILTGGPGAGKSTLLSELERHSLKCIPEVAREIIKEQKETNGRALPWDDMRAYSEMMFERSQNDYEKFVQSSGPVIFDRGIPDVIGYMKLIGLVIPKEFREIAQNYRYNQSVFILPPWEEIYTNDLDRKQTFQEAQETYNALFQTYKELKYDIIDVPKDTVSNRSTFIRKNLR